MVNSKDGLHINSFNYYTISRIPDIKAIMEAKTNILGEEVTVLSCTRTTYCYETEISDTSKTKV
jgi:hypothetical protein